MYPFMKSRSLFSSLLPILAQLSKLDTCGIQTVVQDDDSASRHSTAFIVSPLICLSQLCNNWLIPFVNLYPVLLRNAHAVNLSKTECNRIGNVWKEWCIKYMMFLVKHWNLYAYTNCLHPSVHTALRKQKFLRKCDRTHTSVLCFLYECFGYKEMIDC